MISAALFGSGRMAGAFAEQARRSTELQLQAVVAREVPAWIADSGFFTRLEDLAEIPQVLVDFTLPEGTTQAAQWCASHGVALLSGVTGLGEQQFLAMKRASQSVPVLWAPNLSLGVNLLASLAKQLAAALPPEAQVHIDDVHHQHKKDAPSGTALMLGSAISAGNPKQQPVYSSQRIGEVIGEHEIRFSWAGEEVRLAHAAKDRAVFARGGVSAALWLARQAAGYYCAEDWARG